METCKLEVESKVQLMLWFYISMYMGVWSPPMFMLEESGYILCVMDTYYHLGRQSR